MLQSFRKSLPLSAGIAVVIICSLAVMTTVFSGIIAWAGEKDASAINVAGSVRMATYRMSAQLTRNALHQQKVAQQLSAYPEQSDLWQSEIRQQDQLLQDHIADFERRLDTLVQYQQGRFHQSAQVDQALSNLYERWKSQLKPLVLSKNVEAFNLSVGSYVDEVDQFVHSLQERTEYRQSLQQRVQWFALVATLVVLIVGLIELNYSVLRPVDKLLQATFEFEKGRLTSRVPASGYREFANLSNRFNEMAETIADSQDLLEQRVVDKTAYLTQANQMLNLLFLSSHQLATEPVTLDKLQDLIEQFQTHIPGVEIRLNLEEMSHPEQQQDAVNVLHSEKYFTRHYQINYQNQRYGALRVSYVGGNDLFSEIDVADQTPTMNALKAHQKLIQDELFSGLANLIGTAMSLKAWREQQNQVILLQERNTIARELHDSLAQSLSYLKIQVALLEKMLSRQASQSDILEVTHDLKDGLNNSYRQLREILTTFRLQLEPDHVSFDNALEDAAEEFSREQAFTIEMNNQIETNQLTAREKVHLLHIIREAMSNCARHAQASHVEVNLYQEDTTVFASITDNGVGIQDDYDTKQHHGLLIMQERSSALNAELSIDNIAPSGTKVMLSFEPQFFSSTASLTKELL